MNLPFGIICNISQRFIVGLALCLVASASEASPEVFWASDPVKPGQTVQVTGMGLDAVKFVQVRRLEDNAADTGSGQPASAEILGKSDSTLSFVVPPSFQNGVFSVTLQTPEAHSNITVNAPDVYWIQGDRGPAASPGGWLRLSGRNMAITGKARLKLVSESGKEMQLEVQAPDRWSASFPLPDAVATGVYRASLWNGTGDASAWRDAGMVRVEPRPHTDKPVVELLSNQPDDPNNDDTARINAAMNVLHDRGGGTLLLHFGIYRLAGTLNIPDGVRLKGESRDLVTLIWNDFENPPPALIKGFQDFAIEDMTINTRRHFDVIKGGFGPTRADPVGGNITIRNVTMRASSFLGHLRDNLPQQRLEAMQKHIQTGVAGLLLTGRNIVVEDCDILSSMRPFVVTRVTGARLSGNTFRTGRRGWYGISAPDGVIFENNRVIGTDLQASGGGINTFGGPIARNVLMRNNRIETLYGWDREALTSDGPRGYYLGKLTAEGGRSVRMEVIGLGKLKDKNWEGTGLFVLQGRGVGTVAKIVKRDGDMLELDRDISGNIDAESVVTIVPMQENYLIIGNDFQDVGSAMVFGTGYKQTFAENRALRATGFKTTSLNYSHPQPNFYTQFLDNRTISAAFTNNAGIIVTGRQFKDNTTLLSLGIVIRGNELHASGTISVDGQSQTYPSVRNVLIEQNTIDHSDVGISIGTGVEELTIRDNRMSDVKIPQKHASP
ncbi:right-handed parallel beta-helix repeat-containing protein [Affinirhizobium pseudoryzae]|uniref:right-handed parallel beta-helix repeat-containing protein n=1 Tax=Allorhizobium pseudoryzae TaxID=379684 RepID=UPI0013EA3BEC|nr:right-handed parallel beta-helix repeat-containing protein [Allorhizobium pseudoryzae]